ncbi:MAG: hypothetical protein E5X72_09660 [Mesorhizobium sp.]|uniref:hypothetical protein n=1 Tax=Mesorhizobium sp. TaxID=1871066 RepID=UPI001223EDCE|nr:hypothetical protein [Mesorhizobium sp.]TIP04936.1 MAG: hypothetical protein E5X72_09660 [Mesorhizobium sp.]
MTLKRRVMHDFEISELSAVNSPAQVHAKALIAKAIPTTRPIIVKVNPPVATKKDDAVSFKSFAEAVDHLKTIAGMSGTEAMTKARALHPELFKSYQEAPNTSLAKKQADDDAAAIAKGVARSHQIDALVRTTALAKRVSRVDALRLVRKANPELFGED